jgi:hypothetical protein
MRQKLTRQMSIFSVIIRHDIDKELAAFSEIPAVSGIMIDCIPRFENHSITTYMIERIASCNLKTLPSR